MIGERIRIARETKKLTQEELAKLLGVTKQTVSNWETSTVDPSIRTLRKIALQLRVSSDYILGIEKKPTLDTEGLPNELIFSFQVMIDKIRKMIK